MHQWVESHASAAVRAWGHVSETRAGVGRVLVVTKFEEEQSAPSPTVPASHQRVDAQEGGASKSQVRPALEQASGAAAAFSRAAESHRGGARGGFKRFENDKHIVFVGQLPYSASAPQVQQHFERPLQEGGPPGLKVRHVRLLTDRKTGRSRGMAFVDLESEAAVEVACLRCHTPRHHEYHDQISGLTEIYLRF
eukprot:COSAG01_NODE_5765_length_4043_cov_3.138804_4_plen_194_part_00